MAAKTKGVIGILTGGGDVPGLNPAIRARLSWGVAEVAPGLDPEAAVAQADAAMYAARRARRG